MAQKFMYLLTSLVALLMVACGNNDHMEKTAAGPAFPVSYIPEDSSNVTIEYNDGTFEPRVHHAWGLSAEDTIKVNGTEAFKAAERLEKKAQDELLFGYNYGKTNRLTVTGLAMVYKGKTIYPKDPSMMLVKGGREVVSEVAKPYYELSATNYTLVYGSIRLASARQMFLVDEGYVPAFERAYVIDRDKHNIGTVEAKLANNKINITCLDSLLYAELFDDASLRNYGALPFHSFNECSMSISGQEVNDTTAVVGKSWTGGTASLGGFELSTSWLSNKVNEKNLVATMSTGAKVDFIDSVHVCKWVPAGGKVLSTKKVRVDYAREGQPADKTSVEIDVNITQREKPVTLVRVDSTFTHNAFVSNATVSGNNIAVICNNTASFVKVWSNGKKDQKQDVKYVVTNNFSYTMPAYISSDAKGKSYSFNGSTATVEGKNVTVTFTSRVIADIMFNNKNYKSDKAVPQCEVAVKTIKFGESTAVITFTHDKETVTAEVPVTYNTLKGYERVGDPIHDSWNVAYGTSNGFGIKCDNHVVVREVYTDGSKGNSFDLPYKSTNTWVVSGKTSFVVNSLASVLNVRHDIVNGSATIDGNTINFAHSMSAEKVSKGTFSYQPNACEAVAKYITVISGTQARVDIYHDNTKVGEYTIPVNITEKVVPDTPFDGVILCGTTTDHYADHVSSLTGTDDHVLTKVADGDYRHYWRPMGSKNWSSETLSSIGNLTGKNLAWWYETNKSTRHLGAVEAYEREGESNRWLLIYKDMNGTVQYHLGKAEETINAPFRYPVQRTLQKVVKDGKTLWTFDNVEFFASK